MISASEYTA